MNSIINVPALDLPTMGTESAPSAAPVVAPASAPAASPDVHISINNDAQRGSAGNYTGSTTPLTAFDMEQAHGRLQRDLDAVDSKLNAHMYDPKTGARRDAFTGSDREKLQLQRSSLLRAFEYQATLAVQELPKIANAQATRDNENVAAVNREANISKVAEMLDKSGKPIGRIKAIEIVRNAEINRMIGG